MSVRYLLDTSIVSSPVSTKPDPSILRKLVAHEQECAIAAPVWHELTFGCQRLPRGKRRQTLLAYLQDVVSPAFPVLAYDEAAAHKHAQERARLEAAGRPAPFVDGQIAAIALVNDLTLVTLNTKDFKSYKGLVLEDWSAR